MESIIAQLLDSRLLSSQSSKSPNPRVHVLVRFITLMAVLLQPVKSKQLLQDPHADQQPDAICMILI